MLGFGLGVLLGLTYIGIAAEPDGVSALGVYGAAVGVFAVAWLVGLLFTNTVGIAAMFGMIGAAIGTVVCLFTGGARLAPALALHAVVCLVTQHGMRSRLQAYSTTSRQRLEGHDALGRVPAQRTPEFVKRLDLGEDIYADFYIEDRRLVWIQSAALNAAQPPLELFYAMEVDKEADRLPEELRGCPGSRRT